MEQLGSSTCLRYLLRIAVNIMSSVGSILRTLSKPKVAIPLLVLFAVYFIKHHFAEVIEALFLLAWCSTAVMTSIVGIIKGLRLSLTWAIYKKGMALEIGEQTMTICAQWLPRFSETLAVQALAVAERAMWACVWLHPNMNAAMTAPLGLLV